MARSSRKIGLSLAIIAVIGSSSAVPVQAFSLFGIGAPSSETIASKILETMT